MADLSKIKLNGTTYNFKDAAVRERYGVCSTAKATVAKTVSIPSVTSLYEGLYIFVKFANTNSAADPTLQVNELEAAAIKRYGTTGASTSAASSWNAGNVIMLVYDGTYWQMVDWINTTYSAMTEAEATAGTSTTSRLITPARLKQGVQTWAPVQSVNGDTGSIIVDEIKTTAEANNTEYNIIGTSTTNTNNAAEAVYNLNEISFSKTSDGPARLTIGSTSTPGEVRLYTSASSASGYTDLKSAASGTNTRTVTFPDANGTVALTSDIPSISSWALASSKPSYTFSELTTTPTSISGYGITDAYTKTEVDGMVSGVLHYKGTKATVNALPESGNTTGDVWHITADGSEYAWDGSTWQELGTAVDLSGYVPTSRTVNGKALTGNISLTASDVSALPSSTTYVSSFNGDTGAITYTAPVTSVNGQTGAVTLTIPSAITSTKIDGIDGYIPTISGANTVSDMKKSTSLYAGMEDNNSSQYIQIGISHSEDGLRGKIRLSNAASNNNYTTITPSASSAITLTLPSATGTLALTSQIPSVSSWALAASKPTYTASEVGAAPATDVGNLSNLNTTTKTNVVAAINELVANSNNNSSNTTLDTEWENVYPEWQAGYYYDPDNSYTYTQIPSTETLWAESEARLCVSCTPYNSLIPVKTGETYRYLNPPVHLDSKNAEIPSIIIFNSSKTEIAAYTLEYQNHGLEFTIPANGAWMAVVNYNSQDYEFQKLVAKRHDQDEILSDILADYRGYTPPTPNTLTKAYFCFGVDDLRPGETKSLYDMFDTYDIPYYMAAIPEHIKTCIQDDPYKTNLDYMRLCVAAGGEIVCHSAEVITTSNKNNFDTMYKYFCKNKQELEAYGFKVRGIFKAGGENAIFQPDPIIDAWATHYYDFGDDFNNTFPYNMNRILLDDWETYNSLTASIQTAITNHEFRIFGCHYYNENAELAMETIFDVLENYTEGTDYEIVTPSQLYDILMPTAPSAASGSSANMTYSLSISGNRITLTPSSGTATYIDLPVYNGGVS